MAPGLESKDFHEDVAVTEEKTENAQQANGICGQTGIIHYGFKHHSLKRKTFETIDHDGTNGLQECQTEGQQEYIDFDKVQDDDDWSRNIAFTSKKKCSGGLDILKHNMVPRKRKEIQPCTSKATPNGNSLPSNIRTVSSDVVTDKVQKLGSLCRIKTKSKKKKHKNRKRNVKFFLLKKKIELNDRPVCRFHMEGICAKGNACTYNHPPKPVKKSGLCKFYLNGQCVKGKYCKRMHEEFPCKYYHTGFECYSKESCRFSHKPLTAETKELLDDYLKAVYDRREAGEKEASSLEQYKPQQKPESKVKRPALLGSPSKELREADKTKAWQEEMKKRMQETTIGRSSFEIKVIPKKEITSPRKFSRPNFYSDTLRSPSPKKPSPSTEVSDSVLSSKSSDVPSQPPFVKSEPKEFDNYWTCVSDRVNKWSSPINNTSASEKCADAAQKFIKIKLEEKSHHVSEVGEMEQASSQTMASQYWHGSVHEESPKQSSEKVESCEDVTIGNNSDMHLPLAFTSPPIHIPSHFPLRQRKPFLHNQHNQKKIFAEETADCKTILSAHPKVEFERNVSESAVKETAADYYSSEKDDDDSSSEEEKEEDHNSNSEEEAACDSSSEKQVDDDSSCEEEKVNGSSSCDKDDNDQPLTEKKSYERPSLEDKDTLLPTTPVRCSILQNVKLLRQKAIAYYQRKAHQENIASSSAPLCNPTSVKTSVMNQSPSGIETTLQQLKGFRNREICYEAGKTVPEIKPSIPGNTHLQDREQKRPVKDLLFSSQPSVSMRENTNTFMPCMDPSFSKRLRNGHEDVCTVSENQSPVVEGLLCSGNDAYEHHKVATSQNYISNRYAVNCDPYHSKHIRLSTSPPVMSVNFDIVHSVPNENVLYEKGSPTSNPLKSKNVQIPFQEVVDTSILKTNTTGNPCTALPSAIQTSVSEATPSCSTPCLDVPFTASHLPRSIVDPRFSKLLSKVKVCDRNSQHMS